MMPQALAETCYVAATTCWTERNGVFQRFQLRWMRVAEDTFRYSSASTLNPSSPHLKWRFEAPWHSAVRKCLKQRGQDEQVPAL